MSNFFLRGGGGGAGSGGAREFHKRFPCSLARFLTFVWEIARPIDILSTDFDSVRIALQGFV